AARRFNPEPLDHLILLEKYGREILKPEEFRRQSGLEWRAYFGFLGRSLLEGRGQDFWNYHTKGLATIGRTLDRRELVMPAARQLLRVALDPVGIADGRLRELLWARRGR
ncbi:MAG TPA: hypothetical protein VG963_14435, partial [Polyangiaceae bacterium]|nr:hypothetical protein [Polyangiaceae bacterium]